MLRRRSYLVERQELLTVERVKRFRKEFLMLVRNVKRLQTMKDVNKNDDWRSAVLFWAKNFDEMMAQVKADIEGRLRAQSYKKEWEKTVNEADAKALLRAMGDSVWRFVSNVRSMGFSSLKYYRSTKYGDRPWSDDQVLYEFDKWIPAWERRARRQAPAAWKWLKQMAEWSQRTGLYGGGGEAVVLNTRDVENIAMHGFKVQVLGFDDSQEFDRDQMKSFRAGLALFKRRAAKVYPKLLKTMRPIVLNFDSGRQDFAADYRPDRINIGTWGMIGRPKEVAKVLAHEQGHHIWMLISGKAQKAWSQFVRGGTVNLDLRTVLKRGQRIGNKMARENPILYLQLSTLLYAPAYKDWDLLSLSRIKDYLDAGNDPIVQVTTRPITGYGGKSPQEAFAEAVALLVAYGPRTVLPEIKMVLRSLLPGLRA